MPSAIVLVGVVYTTDKGLYIIVGRTVTELTKVLQDTPDTDFQLDTNLQHVINHIQIAQIGDSLSQINAIVYISPSIVGFNKHTNELIVTNKDYDYPYLYAFKTGHWYKINTSYKLFINSYLKLLTMPSDSENNGVFDLTGEQFIDNLSILMITRPCKLNPWKVIFCSP